MSFKDDLEVAKTVERKYEDVEVLLNGHVHTLRFTASDPDQWADAVDRNPLRLGVAIDRYGFNLRGVVKTLAPKVGSLIVDGEPVKLRVDPIDPQNPKDPERVDEWADLLKSLGGHFIQKIGDAIFYLNVYSHTEALEEAKKKLKRSARISNSRPSSE